MTLVLKLDLDMVNIYYYKNVSMLTFSKGIAKTGTHTHIHTHTDSQTLQNITYPHMREENIPTVSCTMRVKINSKSLKMLQKVTKGVTGLSNCQSISNAAHFGK